jgi:NhaA family Na+:H+ antiporter
MLGNRLRDTAHKVSGWAPSVGLILIISTVGTLILHNTVGTDYADIWQMKIGIQIDTFIGSTELRKIINDGLLTLFFLVVGLEIKDEFLHGSLSKWKDAMLPVVAAAGSMILPAVIYYLVAPEEAKHAWAIPLSADTAFTVALLAVVPGIPTSLRMFLTTAMVIDDIFTVHVVGLAYAEHINGEAITGAALAVMALGILRLQGIRNLAPYLLIGLVLWFLLHEGGIHANFAGILLAFLLPNNDPKISDSSFMTHASSNSMYIVLPIFALANAGVSITPEVFVGHEWVSVAIISGLVIGKPIGLVTFSYITTRLGWAEKPVDITWLQIIGVGALTGIGFTMSLLITERSFTGSVEDAAKLSVFLGSFASAIIGVSILFIAGKLKRRTVVT